MEDKEELGLQELIKKFTNEAEKILRHVEGLRAKAIGLVHKGENITDPEIKQSVRRQAIAELEELTEKLVALNIDLELDYVDCPNLVIPYFTPEENTVHKLKFLSGDNPWNFWLTDHTVDTKGILRNLMLKHQHGLLDAVQKPKAAQSVCFIDRNKVIRGIILQVKSETRVKLVDCDSNMTKVVACDKLFKVDQDACRVHASALRCTIAEEPDTIELWNNSDLRDMFCNTLREATLGVKIIKKVVGTFPMFVVDIELQNEEDNSTANLKEWILGQLLPELKKLGSFENEAVCDYLSEESLSPFHKENRSPEQGEIIRETQDEKLNNLNLPSDKLSEKIVSTLDQSKEENNTKLKITNNFEPEDPTNSESGLISSSSGDDCITSSIKESFSNDFIHKTEAVSDSRLNCQSEEFRPKLKKPDIPRFNQKYQNRGNTHEYIPPYPTYGPTCPLEFGPPRAPLYNQPWHYAEQHQQIRSTNWPYQEQVQPPLPWSSGQDKVNVKAAEFMPKNTNVQPTKDSNRVELPKEHISLRKSATLIKENENLLVLISHVENPSEFYVHFVNQSNRYLDKLYEDMFTYYSTREKVVFDSVGEARTKLGKFCACKWHEDNHWYRVEVLDWTVDIDLVKVCFVDHGNTECVPLSCIQPLVKPFDTLSICSQACHLAEVHPLVKGKSWSEESISFFKSKVGVSQNRVYSVTVVQSSTKAVKTNSFSVLLYEGKATDSSKSINDLLVDQGLAWSRSSQFKYASSTSSENYHSMDDLSEKLTNCDMKIGTSSGANTTTSFWTPDVSYHTPSTVENEPELDGDLEEWDPCREDYEGMRNNPALDIDDACVAVSGYSARDESRICKFYAKDGFCYKAICYKEHSIPNPDGTTTDKEETYDDGFSQLKLPQPGDVVRLKVTSVISVNLFYAQLEEKKGISVDDEYEEDDAETLTSLEQFMNQPENIRQMQGLAVSPATGALVLAREVDHENGTEWWYRARVTSCREDDEIEHPEIMYVDYGTTCFVPEKDLRLMEKRYLHLPFQAIECSIANITPLEVDNEDMKRGIELMQDVMLGQVLTAKIYDSEDVFGDGIRLQVLLQLDNGIDVGDLLIENNICQPQLLRNNVLHYS